MRFIDWQRFYFWFEDSYLSAEYQYLNAICVDQRALKNGNYWLGVSITH